MCPSPCELRSSLSAGCWLAVRDTWPLCVPAQQFCTCKYKSRQPEYGTSLISVYFCRFTPVTLEGMTIARGWRSSIRNVKQLNSQGSLSAPQIPCSECPCCSRAWTAWIQEVPSSLCYAMILWYQEVHAKPYSFLAHVTLWWQSLVMNLLIIFSVLHFFQLKSKVRRSSAGIFLQNKYVFC